MDGSGRDIRPEAVRFGAMPNPPQLPEPTADSVSQQLERRYPGFRRVRSAPSLMTLNGFGLSLYGRNDADPELGTYVKTRFVTALFVPVFPWDAWCVTKAEKGWYFLGKMPLGRVSLWWQRLFGIGILALAAVSGVQSYLGSDGYLAGKTRKDAAARVAAGQPMQAAGLYQDALRREIGKPAEWTTALRELVRAEIISADPTRAAAALRFAGAHPELALFPKPPGPDLADLALERAERAASPAEVRTLLSAFDPSAQDLQRVHERLLVALEELHRQTPGDHETRIQLALLREEFGKSDGALELLEPSASELGEGEGARLYGGLLAAAGRPAEALPFLERYLKTRTAAWQRESERVETAYESARQRIFDRLNATGGPAGFKQRYEAADEAGQREMVEEYVTEQMARDGAWTDAQARYAKSATVVPAIMSLGTVRLRVAQAEADPQARAALLKQAEEAFLSLRNVAGESDEYRLFLGQVYYWSGRGGEGKSLFDELLAAKGRDLATLFALANVYRDIGESASAAALLEEAYPKATTADERASVASLRSMLATSTDERIEWLSKEASASPQLATKLAEARAQKAEEAGDLAAARGHYQEALAAYQKMDRGSATLNNEALIRRSLYMLDGRREDFQDYARLLAEAVKLQPANSILSGNLSTALLDVAVLQAAGDRIPPALMQAELGLNALRYLYQGAGPKAEVVGALKADPNFRKALAAYQEALLLAPKSPDLYAVGMGIYHLTGDATAAGELLAKASSQEFDFSGQRKETARYLSKERDAELAAGFAAQEKRFSALRDSLAGSRDKAMAMAPLAAVRLAPYAIGVPTHTAEWLGELQQAAAEVPCSRLDGVLESALEIAALEALAEDPECAALIEADRRLLGSGELLQLLVRAAGPLGERVRSHPRVAAAREAKFLSARRYPDSIGLDDWLMIEGLHPEQDAALKQQLAANVLQEMVAKLQLKLQADSPSKKLDQVWAAAHQGDLAGARAMLPELEAAGLKLPALF